LTFNWKTWMPAEKTLEQALSELNAVIGSLENAVDMRIEHQRQNSEVEGEVRRVHADRARLAQELDESQFRANRLEEVNREVSRGLVTAMEAIRAVLDRWSVSFEERRVAQVTVTIDDKADRMACEEGQAGHLIELAGRFDQYV